MDGEISRTNYDLTSGLERLRVEMAALAKVFQEGGVSIMAFNESWSDFATKQKADLILTLRAIIHIRNSVDNEARTA